MTNLLYTGWAGLFGPPAIEIVKPIVGGAV